MEEDKVSRKERNFLRKDRETLLRARQSDYIRDMMDDMAGKPEEVCYRPTIILYGVCLNIQRVRSLKVLFSW